MIERIDWKSFHNQVVLGRSAYPWQEIELRVPQFVKSALHYPLASKLRGAAAESATHWLSNTNPLNIGKQDLAWKFGFGAGTLDTVLRMTFISGVGLEQGLSYLLVSQTAFFLIDRLGPILHTRIATFGRGYAIGLGYSSLPAGFVKVAMTPFDPSTL